MIISLSSPVAFGQQFGRYKVFTFLRWVGARPILGNFSKIGFGFHWESTYNKKCVTKNPWILCFSNLLLKVVLKKSLVLSPHIMIQKKNTPWFRSC